MIEKEAEYIGRYPEASLIVAMAESTWAGSNKTAKIEFSLSDNLKVKLSELLGKEIRKPGWVSNVWLRYRKVSTPLDRTSKTTPTSP